MAATKRKRKEKKTSDPKEKSAPAVDPDNISGGTIQLVSKRPASIAIFEPPPQPPTKKLKGPNPPCLYCREAQATNPELGG